MPDYNIAIIGLGMGYRHLRAVEQHPQTKVAAVCDIDIEKARAIAQQHGVPTAVSDYRELLHNPDIDIVIVASPDHLHREQTVTMLEAGKHVLCEKPMAPTLEECQYMVEAQDRNHRKLMIGHIVRFTPIFRTIKQLVDDGELGEIFYVGTDYQHNDMTKIEGWRFDPKRARHVFAGDGCHAVDLMRWFLSDISDVTAVANRKALLQSSTDDCIVACYTTITNQLGRVFVSNGCHRPYNIGLEVYGTRGTVRATNVDTQAQLWLEKVKGLGKQWMTIPTLIDNYPTYTQWEHFISSIENDQTPLIDGREGMLTMRAALAAIHASHAPEKLAVGTSGRSGSH
jgi:UDP-N-acetylglucosamine 3-dehydrogenase